MVDWCPTNYQLIKAQVPETDVMLQGHDTCKYVFTDITFGVPGDTRVLYSVFDVM